MSTFPFCLHYKLQNLRACSDVLSKYLHVQATTEQDIVRIIPSHKTAHTGADALLKEVVTHHVEVLERINNAFMAGQPGAGKVCCQGQHNSLGCLGIKGQLLRDQSHPPWAGPSCIHDVCPVIKHYAHLSCKADGGRLSRTARDDEKAPRGSPCDMPLQHQA